MRLLRDDPVAPLLGSLAISDSCLISRNPLCFPKRPIVLESSSSLRCMRQCTQNLGGTFARKCTRNARRLACQTPLAAPIGLCLKFVAIGDAED